MSLSSWLRDYLYIPLGGNRKGVVLQYRNLLYTMLLGGLWHGSSWNFVIWGGMHGILLGMEKRFNLVAKNYRFLQNILVFVAVSLIWVFFRSLTLTDSLTIFNTLIFGDYGVPYYGTINHMVGLIYGLALALIFDLYIFRKNIPLENLGSKIPLFPYVLLMNFIVINIILFYSSASNFIYFQF